MRMLEKLRRYWQRNFGYVFVTDDRGGKWRFKARRGKIALVWWATGAWVCSLDLKDHLVMTPHGKPWPGWTWSYEPSGEWRDGGWR